MKSQSSPNHLPDRSQMEQHSTRSSQHSKSGLQAAEDSYSMPEYVISPKVRAGTAVDANHVALRDQFVAALHGSSPVKASRNIGVMSGKSRRELELEAAARRP